MTTKGQDMTERTFDWYPRFDDESLKYTIRDNFATGTALKSLVRRQWSMYLDQGSEGACTGFGAAKALILTPKRRSDITNAVAKRIYSDARQRDEWPGEDYEGSSVLGAMQACKDIGYISAYYWATSLKQMQHGVAHLGALVIGVNWYEGMVNAEADGFIRPTGQVVGGHAICVGGIDLKRGAFVLYNSWGADWGGRGGAPKGAAFLAFADAERLLVGEDGEAALMRKV